MQQRDATDPSERLRVLATRPEPHDGFTTISADLGAFFIIVEKVGRDDALLLLVIRALRQRSVDQGLRLHDLAWVLRASAGAVYRSLDRLTQSGYVIYHVEERAQTEIVSVELGTPDIRAWTPRIHALPTHWFIQTLPLLGPTTFTVFLFLLSRDAHEGLARVEDIVRHVRLSGPRHAKRHLQALRAHAILVAHPTNGTLVVRDPRPPTPAQRMRLRLLALPFFALARARITRLAVLALVIVLLLLVVARVPHLHLP